jgi:hypothetical protein
MMKRKLIVVSDSTGKPQVLQVTETRANAKDLGKVSPHMARRIARGEKIKRVVVRLLPFFQDEEN